MADEVPKDDEPPPYSLVAEEDTSVGSVLQFQPPPSSPPNRRPSLAPNNPFNEGSGPVSHPTPQPSLIPSTTASIASSAVPSLTTVTTPGTTDSSHASSLHVPSSSLKPPAVEPRPTLFAEGSKILAPDGPPPRRSHSRPPSPPPRPESPPEEYPDEKKRPPPGYKPTKKHRPPSGPPSGHPSGNHHLSSASSFHSGHESQYGSLQQWGPPPGQQWGPPPGPVGPPGRPHLQYPPGFYCARCRNTGIKQDKGTTCKSCFEKFGVRQQAQYLPMGAMPVFNGPPRIVRPGDPSIGGWLCGRCRGTGVIHDLLIFESPCPICHGVGRVR